MEARGDDMRSWFLCVGGFFLKSEQPKIDNTWIKKTILFLPHLSTHPLINSISPPPTHTLEGYHDNIWGLSYGLVRFAIVKQTLPCLALKEKKNPIEDSQFSQNVNLLTVGFPVYLCCVRRLTSGCLRYGLRSNPSSRAVSMVMRGVPIPKDSLQDFRYKTAHWFPVI